MTGIDASDVGALSDDALDGEHTEINNQIVSIANGKVTAAGIEVPGKFKASVAEDVVKIGSTDDDSGFDVNKIAIYNTISALQEPTGTQTKDSGVYVGTDGIRLGDRFKVTKNGTLYATNAVLSGTLEADSGRIGDFQITDQKLLSSNAEIANSKFSV